MRRSQKRLKLAKETLVYLDFDTLRVAGGKMSEGRWLCPSSGTEWSDQSVCPSYCASDCFECAPSQRTCPV